MLTLGYGSGPARWLAHGGVGFGLEAYAHAWLEGRADWSVGFYMYESGHHRIESQG